MQNLTPPDDSRWPRLFRGPALDAETIHRRRWWTLAILNLSLFAIVMDNTILNVALPTLAKDLQASGSELQWIVDAYVLVFAGLLLSAGALGDRFGRRGALSAGLGIFEAGSIFAPSSAKSARLSGICIGSLFGWPGVAGIICSSDRLKVLAAAS